MVCVNQSNGKYIASSLPKPLLIPSFIQARSQSRDDLNDSQEYLYILAKSKKQAKCSTPKVEYPLVHEEDFDLPPVPGREHIVVQTDLYLEEICDIIDETDDCCQTDPLLDRPDSPLFIPCKTGIDVETQIWPGDLFDFDFEVQPVLEALVNRTIEQSLIEIDAEQEMAELIEQQKEYETRRNVEVAERLRLEEEERRLYMEQEKRIKEQEVSMKQEKETAKKIAACVYAQHYLGNLLPTVYRRLESQGFFVTHDPVLQEIEEDFWPFFMDRVDKDIMQMETSCYLLDSLIQDAVQKVTETSVIRSVTPDIYPKEITDEVAEVEDQDENVSDGEEGDGTNGEPSDQ